MDFDSLWDYSKPDKTEKKFSKLLAELPQDDPIVPELLTQIARAQGLQRKFHEAHQTLDLVERKLSIDPSRAKVRYLLERGRVYNSSGLADQARLLFEQAEEMATRLSEDFHTVDAVHMRATQLAKASEQEKARNWLGSLYNNTGWSYHDLGDYEAALEIFQKAEAWHRSKGHLNEFRIAKWTVARTLRSMNRVAEALFHQMELEKEFETIREEDAYVFEEIGECLLHLNRSVEARPYFVRAFALLSQDPWLAKKESQRLERLGKLGKVK